jgi:hypothetical protein
MYLPLYGAPIWPVVTLACLCGWLISLAAPTLTLPRMRGREIEAEFDGDW